MPDTPGRVAAASPENSGHSRIGAVRPIPLGTMPVVALPPAQPPLPPARILVHADEFFFNGSRKAGPSGKWKINLRNIGEDDHDIRVRRDSDGVVLKRSATLLPKQNTAIVLRLKPGRYTLFCGVADHEARGMKVSLIVRKPKVRTTAP